jgi:hypothetical protein
VAFGDITLEITSAIPRAAVVPMNEVNRKQGNAFKTSQLTNEYGW